MIYKKLIPLLAWVSNQYYASKQTGVCGSEWVNHGWGDNTTAAATAAAATATTAATTTVTAKHTCEFKEHT